MKKHRTLVLALLVFALAGAFVQANVNSDFLANGFAALYYHAVRIEESLPRVNPMGMAITEFEKAARDESTAGEAQLMMGLIYQYLDRPGTALGYYLEFAQSHPEELWVYSFIGDMYAEMGRFDEAESSYRMATTATTTIELAASGDATSGAGATEVATETEVEVVFAQAYVGLGNTALERKDYAQAKEAFEKALTAAGNYFDARLGLGKALYCLEEYDEAIAVLEVAQLQAPRSITMFYYLGLSYEAAGFAEKASHAFFRAEELQQSR